MKPCLGCGTPTEASRCADCRPPRTRAPQASRAERGYDWRWEQLSRRARKLQPWCSKCHTPGTDKNPLTVDHTPAAWQAVEAGRRLTLHDFENGLLSVLCLRCNIAAGHARGSRVTR